MKHGLNEEEFQLLDQIAVTPLKKQGARVWLFGSRASGNHQKFSDVAREFASRLDRAVKRGAPRVKTALQSGLSRSFRTVKELQRKYFLKKSRIVIRLCLKLKHLS